MKERPILFKGEMVRRIDDGSKTQTRRQMKRQPSWDQHRGQWSWEGRRGVAVWTGPTPPQACALRGILSECPYGVPGDRLWVKETWAQEDARDLPGGGPSTTIYRATASDAEKALVSTWKPSIFMPRWAARFVREVTFVRVEKLHDISEEDARAEGVAGPFDDLFTARRRFEQLWESINGPDSWESNPWLWVIGFKRLEEV